MRKEKILYIWRFWILKSKELKKEYIEEKKPPHVGSELGFRRDKNSK